MATATEQIEPKTRAQWLADRMSGIGASEAAAALGESPFKTTWELFLEKTGTVAAPDLSDKLYVRLGQVMERGVGEIFADEVGRHVEFWPQTEVMRHREHTWMFCTPDAFQYDPDRGKGLLSIKTTDPRFRKEWESSGIPLHYQIQAQHELAVTGLNWGSVAVAFGRQTMKSFEFVRHQKFIDALIEKLSQFWRNVQTQTPPPIDWTNECAKALCTFYGDDTGGSVELPPEAATWDRLLQSAKEEMKSLEKIIGENENKIRAAIGENTFGVLPSGERYSWKTQSRREYVVAASTFRVLRRHKM